MELFTPVGEARSLVLTTLRLFVEAIANDQSDHAGAILATAAPGSPDGSQATVAGTIGVALDLIDTILAGNHADAPGRHRRPHSPSERSLGRVSVPPATSSISPAKARHSARSDH